MILAELKNEISARISAASGVRVTEKDIRIPARDAMISCPSFVRKPELIEKTVKLLNEQREEGTSLKNIREKNGWILMDPDTGFFIETVKQFSRARDIPEDGSYCFHRMRMLTRYPNADCPDEPDVHKAILQCLVYDDEPTDAHLRRAEDALLKMAYARAPKERQDLLIRCGDVARAAIQLLYKREDE